MRPLEEETWGHPGLAWCSGWSSSPADTLQTHSGLFLEELEMMVPSTPTSASGTFWKGSELGNEPAAQPAAPSTTSEVVKSKSASSWPARLACLEEYHFIKYTPSPRQMERREGRVPIGQVDGQWAAGHPDSLPTMAV